MNRALPCHVPGGLERHVEDLALGLAGRGGIELHLLTAPMPPGSTRPYLDAGIRLHPVPEANPQRYSLRYLQSVGKRIAQLNRRWAFDLVHGEEFALGFWRPRFHETPMILSVHGTITSETPLHPDVWRTLNYPARLRALARFGRRFLFHPPWMRSLNAARRILVDSEFTRRELLRIAPLCAASIRRVPLAVRETGKPLDRTTARTALNWEGCQLLTVGRLEWQKGHEIALEALARLSPDQLPAHWHYTIVGDGSYRRRLERRIAQLKLTDRVTLAGRVSQQRKQQMLAGADLFLWPERTHPAFGLVGVEAMLASTPILALNRGAIPEILGRHGGWLVDAVDPDQFADALATILSNPSRLRARRAILREDALRRFAFPAMIDAVLAQYRSIAP